MPQWGRDRAADCTKYPDDRRVATCPRADVPLLLRYDHHTVWLRGRLALLRTYHWAAIVPERSGDPLPFEVSFTYAPGHPAAPPAVQAVVDRLAFGPADDGARAG